MLLGKEVRARREFPKPRPRQFQDSRAAGRAVWGQTASPWWQGLRMLWRPLGSQAWRGGLLSGGAEASRLPFAPGPRVGPAALGRLWPRGRAEGLTPPSGGHRLWRLHHARPADELPPLRGGQAQGSAAAAPRHLLRQVGALWRGRRAPWNPRWTGPCHQGAHLPNVMRGVGPRPDLRLGGLGDRPEPLTPRRPLGNTPQSRACGRGPRSRVSPPFPSPRQEHAGQQLRHRHPLVHQ